MKKRIFKRFISLLLVSTMAMGLVPTMPLLPAYAAPAGSSALMVSDVLGQREISLVQDADKYLPAYPMFLNEPNTVSFELPTPGTIQVLVYTAEALNAVYPAPITDPPPADWLRESDTGWLNYTDFAPQNLPDDWKADFLDKLGTPAADLTNGPTGIAFSGQLALPWSGMAAPGWYYMVFCYAESDTTNFTQNKDLALFLPFLVMDWSPNSIEELIQMMRDRGYLLNPDGGWLRIQDLFVGDPVNSITGALDWNYTDLQMEGKKPLAFTRTYNSLYADDDYGLGYGWSYPYNYRVSFLKNKAYVTVPSGATVCFTKNGGEYDTAPGNLYTFTGETNTLTTDTGETVKFNSSGRASQIIDSDGDATNLSYSGVRLSEATNKSGAFTFTYDGKHISSITDSAGRSVSFTYDNGELASAQNPDGDSLRYSYVQGGRYAHLLASVTDFGGTVYMKNEYNEYGRVTQQFLPDRGWTSYKYNFAGKSNEYTDENGKVTGSVYDDNFRLIEEYNNDGSKYYTYDDSNRLSSETDRKGNKTTYTYVGDTTNYDTITYPDSTTESFTYNSKGQTTSVKQRDDTYLRYEYDDKGNLIKETDGNGYDRFYYYDGNGFMTSSKDAMDKVTKYTRDNAGNMKSMEDPLGNITLFD
ncbi:MAG: DUF6531 domain-containing protein [Firmicutes bacterium]|nr:DUF6531 domain-containing protein [Bacillota bacterium]